MLHDKKKKKRKRTKREIERRLTDDFSVIMLKKVKEQYNQAWHGHEIRSNGLKFQWYK